MIPEVDLGGPATIVARRVRVALTAIAQRRPYTAQTVWVSGWSVSIGITQLPGATTRAARVWVEAPPDQRAELERIITSGHEATGFSVVVDPGGGLVIAVQSAKCPPADEPPTMMRAGSMPSSFA